MDEVEEVDVPDDRVVFQPEDPTRLGAELQDLLRSAPRPPSADVGDLHRRLEEPHLLLRCVRALLLHDSPTPRLGSPHSDTTRFEARWTFAAGRGFRDRSNCLTSLR